VHASSTDAAEEDKVSVRQHQAILRRSRSLIEANADNPLLPEICTALGVSARTLPRCCHEQLGVSPLRYLLLRRMSYGFWELDRFATAYRSLFGETLSTTLHGLP
jgi:AraC-like DNA-binding protein